jgi:hypothetical protein
LPSKFDSLGAGGFVTTPIWIETIHRSLSKAAGK